MAAFATCISIFYIGVHIGIDAYMRTHMHTHTFTYMYIYIYIYIWVNYNDLTATSLESWLTRGIIPKWLYFSFVNYYNLPRYIRQMPGLCPEPQRRRATHHHHHQQQQQQQQQQHHHHHHRQLNVDVNVP